MALLSQLEAISPNTARYVEACLPEQRVPSILDVNPNEPDVAAWFLDLDSTVAPFDAFRANKDVRNHCQAAREGENSKVLIAGTNSSISTVDDLIRLHSLACDIGARLTLFPQVPAMRKPSPFMWLQAIQRFRLSPDRIRVIGDKSSDILSAYLAGINKTTQVDRLGISDIAGDRWIRRPLLERPLKALGVRATAPTTRNQATSEATRRHQSKPDEPWRSIEVPEYILNDREHLIPGINCDSIELCPELQALLPPPRFAGIRDKLGRVYPERIRQKVDAYLEDNGVAVANKMTLTRPFLACIAAALIIGGEIARRYDKPKLARALKVAAVATETTTYVLDRESPFVRRQRVFDPVTGKKVPVDLKSPERLKWARRDDRFDKFNTAILTLAKLAVGKKGKVTAAIQFASMLHSDQIQRPRWKKRGYDTSSTLSGKVTTGSEDGIAIALTAVEQGNQPIGIADNTNAWIKVYSRLVNSPIAWEHRKARHERAAVIRRLREEAYTEQNRSI